MAIDYYQGVNGGWENANFVSGAKPVDTDEIVIPSTITVSIDGTDESGVKLTLLKTDRGYVGNIGLQGDPLIIDATKMSHLGSGFLYLKSDDAASTEFTDWVQIDSDNGANLDGEEMTRVTVLKGTVTLASTLGSVTLPAVVEITFRDNPASDAVVTINCALLASTGTLKVDAGIVTTNNTTPIVNQSGGVWTHSDTGADATQVTTYNGFGGKAFWNSSKLLVTTNVYSGCTFDSTTNSLEKQFTVVNVFPNGTFIYDPEVTTIGTLNIIGNGRVIQTGSGGGAGPII